MPKRPGHLHRARECENNASMVSGTGVVVRAQGDQDGAFVSNVSHSCNKRGDRQIRGAVNTGGRISLPGMDISTEPAITEVRSSHQRSRSLKRNSRRPRFSFQY